MEISWEYLQQMAAKKKLQTVWNKKFYPWKYP